MQPSRAIIVGSAIIGACVLAQLGYTIHRDRAAAKAARQEQYQQTKAAAENYKRIQSKEAWKRALKFMDVEFQQWLMTQVKPDKNHVVRVQNALVKSFDLSDIQWDDAHHVTVHGILGLTADDGSEHFFSWSRPAELKDDGVDTWWLVVDHPTFRFSTLTKDQYKDMPVQVIVLEGKELPVVR